MVSFISLKQHKPKRIGSCLLWELIAFSRCLPCGLMIKGWCCSINGDSKLKLHTLFSLIDNPYSVNGGFYLILHLSAQPFDSTSPWKGRNMQKAILSEWKQQKQNKFTKRNHRSWSLGNNRSELEVSSKWCCVVSQQFMKLGFPRIRI